MGQPLEGDRREQDGVLVGLAEQFEASVRPRHVRQDAWQQLQAVEGAPVGEQAQFVGGPTLEPGAGRLVHALARERLVVGHRDHVRWNARERRLQVWAHWRRRLWYTPVSRSSAG